MVQLQYSKTDSLLLKGIGILFIVLHNYIHLFPEFPPECEFKYIPENFVKRTFRAILRDGKNLGKLKEQVKISEEQ